MRLDHIPANTTVMRQTYELFLLLQFLGKIEKIMIFPGKRICKGKISSGVSCSLGFEIHFQEVYTSIHYD